MNAITIEKDATFGDELYRGPMEQQKSLKVANGITINGGSTFLMLVR